MTPDRFHEIARAGTRAAVKIMCPPDAAYERSILEGWTTFYLRARLLAGGVAQ